MEKGYTKDYPVDMRRKDGGVINALLTSNLRYDANGKATELMGTIKDITERKQTTEALKTSEERFRTAAESLTDVVYDWDIKEKVDWYGDIDGIMGYPPGGFPRTIEGWTATINPEDKDRVKAALEDHLKGLASYAVEYRVGRRNGEWRWWSARGTALRDDRGEPYKMIGSISDITERKRAENALRESEEKYRTILKDMDDVYFEVDIKGKITFVNSSSCKMSGYSEEELLGMPFKKISAPDDIEKTMQ
jgi:PAS domain-containing protein